MAKTNHQFRLALPEGWSDQSHFNYAGPELHGVSHVLRLIIDHNVPRGESLESYARHRIDMMNTALVGLETLKDESKTLASGVQAWEWVYKTVSGNQKPVFYQQVYVLRDGRAYTFSIEYSKASFKILAGQIEQIIASFVPSES